jgi:hypothetical protein
MRLERGGQTSAFQTQSLRFRYSEVNALIPPSKGNRLAGRLDLKMKIEAFVRLYHHHQAIAVEVTKLKGPRVLPELHQFSLRLLPLSTSMLFARNPATFNSSSPPLASRTRSMVPTTLFRGYAMNPYLGDMR